MDHKSTAEAKLGEDSPVTAGPPSSDPTYGPAWNRRERKRRLGGREGETQKRNLRKYKAQFRVLAEMSGSEVPPEYRAGSGSQRGDKRDIHQQPLQRTASASAEEIAATPAASWHETSAASSTTITATPGGCSYEAQPFPHLTREDWEEL